MANRLHVAEDLQEYDAEFSVMPGAIDRNGKKALAVAASRSPFYGFFLFLGSHLGTLWLVAAMQALVAAWLLRVTVRTVLPGAGASCFWILVGALAAGSTLPFFASYAMPDVFGGLAILGTILILIGADRLSTVEKIAVWILLTVSVAFHKSNALVLLALTAFGGLRLAAVPVPRRVVLGRAGTIVTAAAAAAFATSAYQALYQRDTGNPQGGVPFLMARLLIDGPGKKYLAAVCPGGASPTLCRFKDRPMVDEYDVLWSTDADGVFGAADYATRVQLERDEVPFVLGAIRFDPWGTVVTAGQNWWAQFMMFFVDDMIMHPGQLLRCYVRPDILAVQHILPGVAPADRRAGDCQRHRVRPLLELHAAVYVLSILLLGFAWYRARETVRSLPADRGEETRNLRMLWLGCSLLLAALVINAAVCGILSGPFPRYQARAAWLIPMFAILGVLVLGPYARRDRGRVETLRGSAAGTRSIQRLLSGGSP